MAAVTICGFAASAPTSSPPQNIAPAHDDIGRTDHDGGSRGGAGGDDAHGRGHRDDKARESREARESHEARESRETRESHEARESREVHRDRGEHRSRYSRNERRGPLTRSGPGYVRPIRESVPVSAQWGVPGGWAAGHHTGVDFAAPVGTPVHSVGKGRVELAGESGSYGNAVIVHMDDGKHVLFAHLSSIAVEQGQSVDAGTPLGASGNTGRSTGPHLHFEVRNQPEYGTEVDPLPYLAEHGVHIT